MLIHSPCNRESCTCHGGGLSCGVWGSPLQPWRQGEAAVAAAAAAKRVPAALRLRGGSQSSTRASVPAETYRFRCTWWQRAGVSGAQGGAMCGVRLHWGS